MTSLQVKFSAIFVALLGMACAGLAWNSIQHEKASLEAEIDRRGAILAKNLAQSAQEPLLANDKLALDALVQAANQNAGVVGVAIVTPKSVWHASPSDPRPSSSSADSSPGHERTHPLLTSGARSKAATSLLRRASTTLYAHPIWLRDAFAGEAQIEIDLERITNPVLRKRARQFTVGALLAALVGVLAGLGFVKLLVGPLQRLRAGVEKLSQGDLSVRVPPTSNDEIGALTRAFNTMGESLEEKERLQSAFGRYVNEHVLTHLLESSSGVDLLGVEREVTVLFVDIRRFTRISEGMKAQDVVTLLNEVFQLISDEILAQGGTIDKFIGDSVMAYFGAPMPQRDHALRAVRAAIAIENAIIRRNRALASGAAPKQIAQVVELGIGIHVGKVVIGNIGSDRRTDFTVVGDTVNVASRLEKLAQPGQILISEAVQREVRSAIKLHFEGECQLSGRQESVHVYSVSPTARDATPKAPHA